MKKWSDFEIKKTAFGEKDYPKILTQIKDPPQTLFFRGNLKNALFKTSLAIVGSRRVTKYGETVVEMFMPGLVSEKVVTISGFMYGVDSLVHQKTVALGGITVAVFGCGLDICYPSENSRLYSAILAGGGAVVSEYEPRAKPHLWKFPQRNRIVAGLASMGVLVIEAGVKSGSLITAKLARKQGKKVFAVPGPIISKISVGTNLLIKNKKASTCLEVGDILGKRVKNASKNDLQNLSPLEQKIHEILETEPLNLDEIVQKVGRDVVQISQTLSLMSLKNLVTETGGKFYLVSK